jgi:hypothetical protein
MYGLGVGFSTVNSFEIFGHFLEGEGAGPPLMVITYIPSDAP